MVFLSYEKDVTGHPENKDVTLRRMTLDEQEDRRAGPVLRRPGDDQRPVLVARRPEDRVRDLSVDPLSLSGDEETQYLFGMPVHGPRVIATQKRARCGSDRVGATWAQTQRLRTRRRVGPNLPQKRTASSK